MAFNRGNQGNSGNQDGNTNTSWKAQGFLNIYMPTKDGGKRKLGAIPLKDSKASEKQLREWLEASDKNLQTLTNRVLFEYQSAEQGEGTTFDLDVAEPKEVKAA